MAFSLVARRAGSQQVRHLGGLRRPLLEPARHRHQQQQLCGAASAPAPREKGQSDHANAAIAEAASAQNSSVQPKGAKPTKPRNLLFRMPTGKAKTFLFWTSIGMLGGYMFHGL
mmetsp:Transcript_68490/g.135357  ORF Transcript_68490/g.135357 Transcript_68490/m.135357 type:complete len:114 (+) Transcript_68490:49-390(+)